MIWIKKHFQKYQERSPWDFCWRISVECFVVSLTVGFLLDAMGLASSAPNYEFKNYLVLWMVFVVGAILETVIFQVLPVWISRKFKASFSIQVLSSVIFFAAANALLGVHHFLSIGIFGGFYLAFTYVHWRTKGFRIAFWITAGSYGIQFCLSQLRL